MYRLAAKHKESGMQVSGLSLLAKGHGLVDGGVEIECLPQSNTYSWMGESFLKPSQSKHGQSAKIIKPYSLNLPKTYITRRGQMVLFTAPEDMIIGKSCHVHEHERIKQTQSLSKSAARNLQNTSTLIASALAYDTEKDSGISDVDGEVDLSPRPGNFTSVYLENLAKLPVSSDQKNDEIDVEIPINTDSDSGFDSCSHPTPTTSGRLSALSNQSDVPVNVFTIPDGQSDWVTSEERDFPIQVRFRENIDYINDSSVKADKEVPDENKKGTNELADIMASLSSTLPMQQPSTKTSNKSTKKKATSVKVAKKKTVPKDKHDTKETCIAATHTSDASKKNGRHPRKKIRKPKKVKDSEMSETSMSTQPVNEHEVSSITAAQLAEELTEAEIDNVSDMKDQRTTSVSERRSMLQSARAEQRRREIEKKRQEKKELELIKTQEMAKQSMLMDELSSYKEEANDNENTQERSIMSLMAEDTTSEEIVYNHSILMIPQNYYYNVEDEPSKDESEVQDTLKKARELKEKAKLEESRQKQVLLEEQRQRQLKEEREIKHKKDLEHIEDLKREKAIKDAGRNLKAKEELNYKMRLELEAQKHQQRKSPSHIFSYFCYLPNPPKQTKDKKKKQRNVSSRKK